MSDSTTCRAVTFRLHPGSRARHVEIARTAGACRHVWNHFLAKNRREYALWKASHDFGGPECHGLERPPVTYQSLGVQFTQLRKATPWLAELPYLPVRYALKYQADAWKRAFERGGFPKFKWRRGRALRSTTGASARAGRADGASLDHACSALARRPATVRSRRACASW